MALFGNGACSSKIHRLSHAILNFGQAHKCCSGKMTYKAKRQTGKIENGCAWRKDLKRSEGLGNCYV